MSKSELISFFDNANNYTEFEIRKKIYDLTNNLDVELLYDLINEYKFYISSLLQKINVENGKVISDVFIKSHLHPEGRKIDIIQRRSRYIDTHLKDNSHTDINHVRVESDKFLDIIHDLFSRKINDLPKDSRLRNNAMFSFFEEILDDQLDMYSDYNNHGSQDLNELIDLSDTSLIEKVIYLEKLGIIEFLRGQRPFSTSANSVANVFSAITGAKPTSLQPIINPLINKDYYNKNYPLNSKKTVISVEGKLTSLGFEITNKSKE